MSREKNACCDCDETRQSLVCASRVERDCRQCTMQRRFFSQAVDDEVEVGQRRSDRCDSQEELGPMRNALVAVVKQPEKKKMVETSSQASSNDRDGW